MEGAKRRIVHLITQLELGGAQRNTLYTVSHLNRNRFEPILICGPGGLLDSEATAGDWLTRFIRWLVRPIRPFKDLLAAVAIYRALREIRPHVVHTHSSKAGILGRLAAYLAGVPVIIHTFHGFGFTPTQSAAVRYLYVGLERFCARLSTQLIFVSKSNEIEAQDLGISCSKPSRLIRSGIILEPMNSKSQIREELHLPKEAWVVVSVGNFKPQKNPLDLIKVAKAIVEQDSGVHLVLVGDGELRTAVESAIEAAGLTEHVHLLGWRQDIPSILLSADAFLLTSLWEGLPRALVEAAVAQLPAVAYAVNGVQDILIANETGFPVPPGNTASAAEKLLWIKNHPAEARGMAKNARARIMAEFDIDKMVREQENLYEELYQAVPLKNYYESTWLAPTELNK